MKKKQDIYAVLKREHEEVDELFHQIEAAKGKAALELFARLKLKLVPHSRAEEAVVYPRLQRERAMSDKVREALVEHQEVDDLIAKIEAMSPGPDWSATVRVLADMVGHHVDEEEGELFPLARQSLSEREAEQLAEKFAEQRQLAEHDLVRSEQRGAAE